MFEIADGKGNNPKMTEGTEKIVRHSESVR